MITNIVYGRKYNIQDIQSQDYTIGNIESCMHGQTARLFQYSNINMHNHNIHSVYE